MKTVTEILREAADIIEEIGHPKGVYRKVSTGGVCAVGAMKIAISKNAVEPIADRNDARLLNKAKRTVALYVEPESKRIFKWNDAKERTAEEVVDTLRTIAALRDIDVNQEERQDEREQVAVSTSH